MKMQDIHDLSREEILKLTDSDIDTMVKLQCAEEGIPLMPDPPNQEYFEMNKTVTAYSIPGTEFFIKDQAVAAELAKFLSANSKTIFNKKYDWRTGYEIEWLEPSERDFSFSLANFYDKALIDEKEQFLVKRKTLKEKYDTAKKEYDKSKEQIRKISDRIYSAFYDARTEQEQINQAQKTFNEYLALADGDHDKAERFFSKAFQGKLDEKIYWSVIPKDRSVQMEMPADA